MIPVRPSIRISWQRSRASHVDADRPQPAYVDQGDPESVLLRAARPVLATLSSELADEPACLILTDPHGVVLDRSGGAPALLSALDSVLLAPGFRYAEAEVGTNGIGTALETGGAILVDGDEHYTGLLRPFSCAGVPITHPVTGRTLGVIDITTKAENSNSLLLSFAKLTARRIQERILEEANALDGALLNRYYAACRHSGGPVVAVGEKIFMMNALAQQNFDAGDQAALLAQTRETIGRADPCTILADLPSGITARLAYQPAYVGDALAGGIVQIREQRTPRTIGARTPGLPGVAGTGLAWRHVCREVLDAVTRSEWVVLEGESGVGKLALLTATHDYAARQRHLSVIDADHDDADPVERAAAALEGGDDVVLHHAHRLSPEQLDALTEVLQRIQDSSVARDPWVALTTSEEHTEGEVRLHLLHFFPRTVAVPPLRHHLEDVPALVRLLLDRAGATDLRVAKPAMNQLMRHPWPGNIAQLRHTLLTLARTRRSGVVELEDLPAECRATTRRSLSRMETLERDAIIEALDLHGGDKAAASESLGMSRATIYRKIRDYGILT
ncbi:MULTISPECIES: sigma-54-dependent Fis family transcriptional regulator [unclassified Nocardioides]|uniref:sigma-54-dependent Fis family transcriptional regulator n=1 Tax=unclassified Nocardioides TaxID=2615069 RepID=UPI001E315BE0|nr:MULTISPECIES: helix-turn-helix domain-containing protein [unclassified Nocardioides]